MRERKRMIRIKVVIGIGGGTDARSKRRMKIK